MTKGLDRHQINPFEGVNIKEREIAIGRNQIHQIYREEMKKLCDIRRVKPTPSLKINHKQQEDMGKEAEALDLKDQGEIARKQ